jgi:MauM/NapG family ferredoxin protein
MSSLNAGSPMSKDPKDPKGVSRRELLTFWRKPLESAVRTINPPPPLQMPIARPAPLRPPGVLHELLLQNHCIRCGKCVEVCPADAIFPLGADWGAAAGTPAIDARKQPCVLCTGLQCSHVCPSGALLPTHSNNDVMMGKAQLDVATCLTHHGQACTACVEHCPRPGALVLDGPHGELRVDEQFCVGCGLCEKFCPTEPQSIRVQPRA